MMYINVSYLHLMRTDNCWKVDIEHCIVGVILKNNKYIRESHLCIHMYTHSCYNII